MIGKWGGGQKMVLKSNLIYTPGEEERVVREMSLIDMLPHFKKSIGIANYFLTPYIKAYVCMVRLR